MTLNGWRELVVDSPDDTPQETFKLCLANAPTKPVHAFKHMLPPDAPVGERIEISPETQRYTRLILDKMDKDSACLVVDYGNDHPSTDSLRVYPLTRG
jgi:SAM-dependent MidA family methyltransferase